MFNNSFDKTAARLDTLEKLTEQRFAANQEAIRVAFSANDVRLEGMNGFRATITEMTNKMITRVEALSALQATARKTDSDVEMLRERLERSQRPNYPLLIGIMSVIATLVTGLWLIIGLKIDTSVSPLDNRVIALETRSGTLNTNVITAFDRINTIRNEVTRINSGQIEIETQFCANDIVRNLMHAQDLRMVAMLWHKVMPENTLPTDNSYYPQVCNRQISAQTPN